MIKPMKFLQTILLSAVAILIPGLNPKTFSGPTIQSSGDLKIVHAGTLFTGPRQPVLHQQTILIRGKLIEAIRPGYLNPSELNESSAEVIDRAPGTGNVFEQPFSPSLHSVQPARESGGPQ